MRYLRRTRFESRSLVACVPLWIAVATLSMAPATPAAAGEPGSAGVLSMRLGVGARSGAMGDTGVAAAQDGSALYWNPASLAWVPGTQLTVQHMEYFEGLFRKESLALAHSLDFASFGLLVSGFYSEELQRTAEEPAGAVQGTFQPYDLVVGAGGAFRFHQEELGDFALGASLKFVYERIDLYDGTAFAVDLGVTHRARIEGLTVAAALQNFGTEMKLNEQAFDLPRLVRFGLAFQPPRVWNLDDGAPRITASAEILMPNDGNSRLHAGAEVRIHEMLALRGGHRFKYDTWGSTFGAGFRRGSLQVDYAYMANRENTFDATHRFSLTVAKLP